MANGLYLGGSPSGLYLGGEVKEAYIGNVKIYENYPKTVTIGSYEYPVVKIGNLLWLAENFKENTAGSYGYEDEETAEEKKYGRQYKWYDSNAAVTALLPSGWRIPTTADCKTMTDIYGQGSGTATHYCVDGDNSSGFSAPCSGYSTQSSSTIVNIGTRFAMWTSTKNSEYDYAKDWFYFNFTSGWAGFDNGSAKSGVNTKCSFRLCKDA